MARTPPSPAFRSFFGCLLSLAAVLLLASSVVDFVGFVLWPVVGRFGLLDIDIDVSSFFSWVVVLDVDFVGSYGWPVMGRLGSFVVDVYVYPLVRAAFGVLGFNLDAALVSLRVALRLLDPYSSMSPLVWLADSVLSYIFTTSFHPSHRGATVQSPILFLPPPAPVAETCYAVTYLDIVPCLPRPPEPVLAPRVTTNLAIVSRAASLSGSAPTPSPWLWFWYLLVVWLLSIAICRLAHSRWFKDICGYTALEEQTTRQAQELSALLNDLLDRDDRLAVTRSEREFWRAHAVERRRDHGEAVEDRQDGIQAATARVQDAQQRGQALVSTAQQLESRVNTQNTRNAQACAANTDFAQQLDARQANDARRVPQHDEAVSQKKGKISKSSERKKRLRARVAASEAAAQEKAKAHSQAAAQLKEVVQVKQNELAQVRGQVESQSSEDAQLQGAIESTEAEVETLSQDNQALRDRHAQQEGDIVEAEDAHDEQVAVVEEEIAETEDATTNAMTQAEQQSSEASTLQHRLAYTSAANAALSSNTGALQQTLEEQQHEEQAEEEAHAERTEQMEGALADADAERDAATGLVHTQSDQIDSLDEELDDARMAAHDAQDEHATRMEENQTVNAGLSEDLETRTAANQELRRTVDALEEGIEEAQAESGALQLQLVEAESFRATRSDLVREELRAQAEQQQAELVLVDGATSSAQVAHSTLVASHAAESTTNSRLTTDLEGGETEKVAAAEAVYADDAPAQEQHERDCTELKVTQQNQRAQLKDLFPAHGALKTKNDKLKYEVAVSTNEKGNLRVAGWEIEAQMREDEQVYDSCNDERARKTRAAQATQQGAEQRARAAEGQAQAAQTQLHISETAFTVQIADVDGENSRLAEENGQLAGECSVLRDRTAAQEADHSAELDSLDARLLDAEGRARPQTEDEVLGRQDARMVDLEQTIEALQVGQVRVKEEIQMHAEARAKAEEEVEVLSESLEFQDAASSVSLSGASSPAISSSPLFS